MLRISPYLLVLIWCAVAAGADALPEVPDPLGLGRRLALIDLLQSTYGLQVEPGISEAALDERYRAELAKHAPPAPVAVERVPAAAATPEPAESTPTRAAVAASQEPRSETAAVAAPAADRTSPPHRIAALSRDVVVVVPDEDWSITMPDLGVGRPVLRPNGDGFVAPARGRDVIVSLFVERAADAGRTDQAVRDHYWALAARNPLIDPSSIVRSVGAHAAIVTYTTAGIANANYYCCFRDRWIDVHVSDPGNVGPAVFAAFAQRLACTATPPKPNPTDAIVAGQRVRWTVPDGWHLRITQSLAGQPAELSLRGPGVRLDGALAPIAADRTTRSIAEGACAPFVTGSVERTPALIPIGADGFVATLTDASLVGLPPRDGKYLLATGGAVRCGPVVAVFGIFHQTATDAEPALGFIRSLHVGDAPVTP